MLLQIYGCLMLCRLQVLFTKNNAIFTNKSFPIGGRWYGLVVWLTTCHQPTRVRPWDWPSRGLCKQGLVELTPNRV